MKDNVLFLNMFALYQPPEQVEQLLAQAAIRSAQIDPAQRRIELELDTPRYLPERLMKEVRREIEGIYALRELAITQLFPPEELSKMEPEELAQLFVAENSMTKGSLAGAQWVWDGLNLTVKLRANGRKMLEECLPKVRGKLAQMCGFTSMNTFYRAYHKFNEEEE